MTNERQIATWLSENEKDVALTIIFPHWSKISMSKLPRNVAFEFIHAVGNAWEKLLSNVSQSEESVDK